jgi:hypothetical protein
MLSAAFPVKPTEARRKSFESMMFGLADNLPCGSCGMHLREYLTKNPIYQATETNETLQRYIYDLHEEVNQRRSKTTMHSFEEVKKAFKQGQAWTGLGSYPIAIGPTEQPTSGDPMKDANGSVSSSQSESSSGNSLIWIIVALSFVVAFFGALAIYFYIRQRSSHKIVK